MSNNVPIRGSRVLVGRVPFETTTMTDAVDLTIRQAQHGGALPIRLSNAYCVALAENDAQYRELLSGPGLNLPDGLPVVWAMKCVRSRRNRAFERVRGPSFFRHVIDHGRGQGIRHFMLGTTDETLIRLEQRLKRDFPGAVISGTFAPPFAPLNDAFIAECRSAIERTDAQLVWVGLGTPKQDYVAAKLAEELNIPCLGVGAAFDFSSGAVKEAPEWVQRSGFEWVFRLSSDPKRLWRRYLIGNLVFLKSVAQGAARGGDRGNDVEYS